MSKSLQNLSNNKSFYSKPLFNRNLTESQFSGGQSENTGDFVSGVQV